MEGPRVVRAKGEAVLGNAFPDKWVIIPYSVKRQKLSARLVFWFWVTARHRAALIYFRIKFGEVQLVKY
jgi:hypothetical protein